MKIAVVYTDASGTNHSRSYTISFPRFVKHFVLAGAGFTPSSILLARGLGAVSWYWDFVLPVANGASRFGEPPPILRDPTLKAHFSNLVGRALADFLGREIEGSWMTLSYEGVMSDLGVIWNGRRPDLLAVAPLSVVALEAKGYAKKSVSAAEVMTHKDQARQGPLQRHSWAAAVAYSLYDAIKVKYQDPTDEAPKPNPNDTRELLQHYFASASNAAREFGAASTTVRGRRIASVPLREVLRGRVPAETTGAKHLDQLALLIDPEPPAFAALKQPTDAKAFELGGRRQEWLIDTEDLFIDVDGIGISAAG